MPYGVSSPARAATLAGIAFLFWLGMVPINYAEVAATFDTLRLDGVSYSQQEDMEVQGVVTETSPRNSLAKVVIRGVRVNGRGVLDDLRFHLIGAKNSKTLEDIKEGEWLSVKGRWGDFFDDGPWQSVGLKFSVFQRIAPAPPAYKDFASRECQMTGIAVPGGKVRCGQEFAQIEGLKDWPSHVVGKEVEVQGTLQQDNAGWVWRNATWNPAALTDRLDTNVTLTGELWSLNGHWWFQRKGDEERICLTSASGAILKFDVDKHHGGLARVTGRLVRQLRPSLEQISLKTARDLVPQYTVRDAKVEHVGHGRFRWHGLIDGEPTPSRDGLPLLEPKLARVNGLLGYETRSLLMRWYNESAIEELQQDSSPRVTAHLAAQMEAPGIDPTLKLVCAGILAARNDDRGRRVLRDAVASPSSPLFPDAIECFFSFPFLPHAQDLHKVDVAWAEQSFLDLLASNQKKLVASYAMDQSPDRPRVFTPSEAIFYYAGPTKWLSLQSLPRLRQTFLDFSTKPPADGDDGVRASDAQEQALSDSDSALDARGQVIAALCQGSDPVPAETLYQWADHLAGAHGHGVEPVVRKCLRQGDIHLLQIAGPQLKDFADADWFRKGLTPEMLKALEKMLPTLDTETHFAVSLLLIQRSSDPVSGLLPLLENPEWYDKASILAELRTAKDPRVISPLLAFLAKVKEDVLPQNEDLRTAYALENAFTAIASADNDEALKALVSLLRTDFGRAGRDYMNDDDLHRLIAALLIESTGESFGTNADAWMTWIHSRPK